MHELKELQFKRALVADRLRQAQQDGDGERADALRRDLADLHGSVEKLEDQENAFIAHVLASGGGKSLVQPGPRA